LNLHFQGCDLGTAQLAEGFIKIEQSGATEPSGLAGFDLQNLPSEYKSAFSNGEMLPPLPHLALTAQMTWSGVGQGSRHGM
jgi:hypothetical protein